MTTEPNPTATETSEAEEAEQSFDSEDEVPYSEPPVPRWQKVLGAAFAIVMVAALAFAIGRFTAFDSSPAASVPSGSSPEAGFARDMQTHHQQAVNMAMLMYGKAEDADLKAVTYDIATGQATQAGQMQQWLMDWNLPAYSQQRPMQWMAQASGHEAHGQPNLTDAELRDKMGMATDAELNELANAEGNEANCLFLSLMIRHHTGAIDMIDAVQQLGSNPGVLDLADKMAKAQTSEIEMMKSMQTRFGCQ